MSDIYSWDGIPETFNAPSLFKKEAGTGWDRRVLFLPLFTLYFSLQRFCSDKTLNTAGLHIVIAGAGPMDAINNGDMYKLLPLLLPSSSTWTIDLVGPEVKSKTGEQMPRVEKAHIPPHPPKIGIHKRTLQHYLSDEKKCPTIIVMNNPGFESNYESWFLDGVFHKWLLANPHVKVIGSSYGRDEVHIDSWVAKSCGFHLNDATLNPYNVERYVMNGESVDVSEYMQWSGTVWRIKPDAEFAINSSRLALLEKRSLWNGVMYTYGMTFLPSQTHCMIHFLNSSVKKDSQDGDMVLVAPDLYLALTDGQVYSGDNNHVMTTELTWETLKSRLEGDFVLSGITASLIAAVFAEKYEDAFDMAASPYIQDDVDDGLEEVWSNLATSNPNAFLKRKMTSSERRLREDAKRLPLDDFIKNYNHQDLLTYKNEDYQNLLVEAMNWGNIKLLSYLLKHTQLSMKSEDSDCFHGWDVLAELDTPHLIDLVVSIRGVDEINTVDSLARNASGLALMRGCVNAYDTFKKHGGTPYAQGRMLTADEINSALGFQLNR